MRLNEFYCQPCDHKWYQHRNPDPQERQLGVVLMVVGFSQILLGWSVLLGA